MRPMLRVALRPRFLGLLAAMIAATVVCGLLATWQWDRAHRALKEASTEHAAAAPLDQVLRLGAPVTNAAAGRTVTATGTFAPREQVLVPGRRIDGTDAVIVVTALHVPQANGTTARLPVARGWIPADKVAGSGGRPDAAQIPAAPSGRVTVTGRIEGSESASSGLENGRAQEIATPLLVNAWGSPMYAGFLAATSAQPGLHPMPEATSDFSRGLNWQNVGYTVQWLAFGGFFLYLWWRSVRTRFLDEEAERADAVAARLARTSESSTDHSRWPQDATTEHTGQAAQTPHGAHAAPSDLSPERSPAQQSSPTTADPEET